MPGQRSRFHDVDWQEVLDRLTAYAVQLFSSIGLFGPEAVVKGIGKSPEDLAAETAMKVVTEQGVKYQTSKGPLVPFLAKVMLNDFRDLLRKSAYKAAVDPVVPRDAEGRRRSPQDSRAVEELTTPEDPFSSAFDQEQKNYIRRSLGNEGDLRDVVDAVLELNCEKPSEIAEALGVSTKEVQNRKKRLRRRLVELHAPRGRAPEKEA